MALLSSHLQVHEGLIVALITVLRAADRALTLDELATLLQPGRIPDRRELLVMTRDASDWFGLVHGTEKVELTEEGQLVADDDSFRELRSHLRRNLSVESDREAGQGDLARALAWLLAQDAWDFPSAYESASDSVELRQNTQFPSGPEFVNKTKWPAIRRWSIFLGLTETDPGNNQRLVPDPTSSISELLGADETGEWNAAGFVEFLASRCPVLDGGSAREDLLAGLSAAELPWEHDTAVLSPSISVALLRLEHLEVLELRQEADAPAKHRRLLALIDGQRVVDKVILKGGRA